MTANLYISNTNTIELDQLANAETSLKLDSSYTVRATLTLNNVNVSGETWPVALTYAGADGRFVGRLSHLLVLTAGLSYNLRIEAFNAVDNVYGEWNETVVATVRGAN